jgi:hypothetical protein
MCRRSVGVVQPAGWIFGFRGPHLLGSSCSTYFKMEWYKVFRACALGPYRTYFSWKPAMPWYHALGVPYADPLGPRPRFWRFPELYSIASLFRNPAGTGFLCICIASLSLRSSRIPRLWFTITCFTILYYALASFSWWLLKEDLNIQGAYWNNATDSGLGSLRWYDRGGAYGNALCAASYGGHEKIVKLLLEKGADVNTNALYAASSGFRRPRGDREAVT